MATEPEGVTFVAGRLTKLLLAKSTVPVCLVWAPIAVMRRRLMDSTDRDLNAAAVPTATQVLSHLLNHQNGGIPTNYAVRFMPTDGSTPYTVNPTGERQHPDRACRDHSGQARDAAVNVLIKLHHRLLLSILDSAGGDPHGEDMVGIESRGHPLEPHEAAHQQTGAAQHHNGERHLGHDE